ncbi:MAG: ribbon-helix-helix domain-containing protein [Thermoplasmata archaeon]
MAGKKQTTERTPVMVRLPKVLIDQIVEVAESEGWSNRQAFIEQAVREKLERWKKEHPPLAPRST